MNTVQIVRIVAIAVAVIGAFVAIPEACTHHGHYWFSFRRNGC